MKLQGKVAVVTGGNSGIGLAIAREFAEQGADVVVFGRNAQTLDEAVRSIGNGTLGVQGDVTRLDDLDRLYQETVARFGKIDILVANAGIARPAPLDLTDEALFDLTSDINFKGAFFTVQKAVPHLNDGASIILVTSAGNVKGLPNFSVYVATKAAVRSLARSFSAELLPRGIRVNALSPGPIETPIFGRMGLPEEAIEGIAAKMTEMLPIKRFGKPEEMAKAALFLASSDSSFVVGAELVADGGMSQL